VFRDEPAWGQFSSMGNDSAKTAPWHDAPASLGCPSILADPVPVPLGYSVR